MNRLAAIGLAILAGGITLTGVTPAAAQEAASKQPARYSTSTTLVGQLLDDPAAAAVLKKMIPTVYSNDLFQTSGRDLSLKDVQQYEPDALSDANLARIQAELDKIPAKN